MEQVTLMPNDLGYAYDDIKPRSLLSHFRQKLQNEDAAFDELSDWILFKNLVILPISLFNIGTSEPFMTTNSKCLLDYKVIRELKEDVTPLIEKCALKANNDKRKKELTFIIYCLVQGDEDAKELLETFAED